MTKDELADAILWRLADWPDEALTELFKAMDAIEEAHGIFYELSPEELEGVERGLADLEAGRIASDEEVAALFAKVRGETSKV
jgi:predicted transcriptional regulator